MIKINYFLMLKDDSINSKYLLQTENNIAFDERGVPYYWLLNEFVFE